VTRQQFNATEHETSEPVKKWLAKSKERIERGKKEVMITVLSVNNVIT
jgi:hypothetical protein